MDNYFYINKLYQLALTYFCIAVASGLKNTFLIGHFGVLFLSHHHSLYFPKVKIS
jgi:hypothetical protein